MRNQYREIEIANPFIREDKFLLEDKLLEKVKVSFLNLHLKIMKVIFIRYIFIINLFVKIYLHIFFSRLLF
jgi:hypothetical protein